MKRKGTSSPGTSIGKKKYKLKRSILLFSVSGKRPAGTITYDSDGIVFRSLASDNRDIAHSGLQAKSVS